ncbi:MAG: hypothetical protein GXC94_13800 [Comamonadaceae bacterium]|jgi:hypothetical protein|nr:hypothetical protein [Comamonadaceae bacterium]
MTPSLLPAPSRVLAGVDAQCHLRAPYALAAGFCLAGLPGAPWVGLALAVAFFGVIATGLLGMDRARGPAPAEEP